MARVIVALPEDLELKFRELAMKKFGIKRGYLKNAFIEAIQKWVENESQPFKGKEVTTHV